MENNTKKPKTRTMKEKLNGNLMTEMFTILEVNIPCCFTVSSTVRATCDDLR
jgi:hypothetical protein